MQVTKTVEQTTEDYRTQDVKVFAPRFYDHLKNAVQIYLPALSALYLGIAQLYGIPAPEKIVGTIALVTTFLGVCLKVSSTRYASSDADTVGAFVVAEDGGGAAGYRLILNENPETLADKQRITFAVNKVAA